MDVVDICAATSTEDHKHGVKKKKRNGHKRLPAARPPAMQSGDKKRPKQRAEEWGQSAARLPPHKPPQDHDRSLRFLCPQCKDTSEYAPKDLVRHFEDKHRGSPPVFSCHTCTFSTNKFPFLQVHLLSHKDTFSSCSMCNDNVPRTWPEFSAHLTTYHCPGGKYSCETCQRFSTGDFRVFLEHIYGHKLNLEEAGDEQDCKTQAGQFCSLEACEKLSMANGVRADHVCQNGNQRKRRLHSISVKPNDTIPGIKTRITRSSVRDTCWLPQDCLSLPGREFLDKYCHLSDPQTTLEETQQFLMETVAADTDQKWTEALKTVLSNVPPDMSLYQTEDGIDTSDLAVLTVKNQITVAQNYGKRLKMSADKKAVCLESPAGDQNERALNRKEDAHRPPAEQKLHDDMSAAEPPSCAGTQENRENLELKMDGETEADAVGDDTRSSGDVKDEAVEKTFDGRVLSRGQKQKRRRRRKSRFKKALKVVLKKNSVKEKQRASQSSSPEELSSPPAAPETLELLNAVDCFSLDPQDPPGTRTLIPQSESLCCSVEPSGPEDGTRTRPATLEGSSTQLEEPDPPCSAAGRIRTGQRATSETEDTSCEDLQLQNTQQGSDRQITEDTKSFTAAVSPPEPQGEPHLEASPERSEQTAEEVEDGDVSSGSCTDLSRIQVPSGGSTESSPGPGPWWQPVPKHQERTLKLVAINSCQPVKRPAGDQPVVVLNHPDADTPQVARIMEVVSRHREVQKVILSRRTLSALSSRSGDTSEPPAAAVQERFALKLKLRRLSRKTYEVVGSASPGRDSGSKFPCWFCGRIFTSPDAMALHRQRHLMEWKRPNCEK